MIFRKYISFFLAFLLLVSNTGLAFNVHYCSDKIAAVSLNTSSSSAKIEKTCCATKFSKKDDCCKNKTLVFEKKNENCTLKCFLFSVDSNFIIAEQRPLVFCVTSVFKKHTPVSYYCDANAPPLFKLYSQYLLYDQL